MSIGLGIFLSTLLLIIVWQVDKRSAWRRFGKILGVLLALGVLLGAGIAGYVWWDNESSRLDNERLLIKEKQAVTTGELNEYWGVNLGMSKDEVLYLKGEPTQRLPPKELSDDEAWVWEDGDTTRMLFWERDGRIKGILCTGPFLADCERVAGLGLDSKESELKARLGEPIKSPSIRGDGVKDYLYGSESTRWRFSLERQSIRAILLYTPDA